MTSKKGEKQILRCAQNDTGSFSFQDSAFGDVVEEGVELGEGDAGGV